MGVFLVLSVQAVDAIQVPFIIGKLISTFEDEFLSCFCQIPSSVGFKGIVLQVLVDVFPHLMDS